MEESSKKPIAFIPTPKEIASLMVSLITKSKTDSILDPGCGKGIFIECLKEQNFTNITGVELNKELYNFCKNKLSQSIIINHDFLDLSENNKFDVIIGNPPYTHYNSLPTSMKEKVYSITKTRETDIYYAFIIKAVKLLKDEGELIFIVPYSFFYNTFAKTVREILAKNGFFEVIIDLDEVNLFEGELPETIIFKFKKVKEKRDTIILKIKTRLAKPARVSEKALESLEKGRENELFSYFLKKFNYKSETWSTFPDIDVSFFNKLSELAFVGVGMVSGYDKAFRPEEKTIKLLNDEEQKRVFPFVKGENCKGYFIQGCVYYFLPDSSINSEEELSKKYPNFYSIILSSKENMIKRYLPKNRKWFHWQALRNYETYRKRLDAPKIFVPTLDRSKINRFSLTYEKFFPSGDVITIIPYKDVDPFFLLGYLNSDFFRRYYFSYGGKRGNRVSYTQRLLSNAKIPKFSEKIRKIISSESKKIFNQKSFQDCREKIEKTILKSFEENLFDSV